MRGRWLGRRHAGRAFEQGGVHTLLYGCTGMSLAEVMKVVREIARDHRV